MKLPKPGEEEMTTEEPTTAETEADEQPEPEDTEQCESGDEEGDVIDAEYEFTDDEDESVEEIESALEFVRRWYVEQEAEEPEDPREKIYMTDVDLRALLVEQLSEHLGRAVQIYMGDEWYYCPPLKDVEEIVALSALDRKTYVEERFDCDNFAITLKSHFGEAAYKDGTRRAEFAMGIVWGMFENVSHAVNFVVCDDRKVRFIEPQTDEIFEASDSTKDIWFLLL